MERLTKYLASGAADYNYPADCYSGDDSNDRVAKSAYRQTGVERLAAYEDTRLTPERCAEFARADAEGRYIVMRDAEQEGVSRLRELAEADKDGRLVVLPCKAGDTLWVTGRDNVPRKMKLEAPDIRAVCTDEDNLCMSTCNRKPDGFCAYRLRNDGADVGKTVFLTREEAEKALKTKEG
jgi:hypothetical protein|nr:MAG TPA: hypothetical protein [Caudoviricetes sp.]